MNTISEALMFLHKIDKKVQERSGMRITTSISVGKLDYTSNDPMLSLDINEDYYLSVHVSIDNSNIIGLYTMRLSEFFTDEDIVDTILDYVGEEMSRLYEPKNTKQWYQQ